MSTIKKLTSKTLGCDKETIQGLVLKEKIKPQPLYHIVGGAIMATIEDGKDDKDDYVKLVGDFTGQSIITGEELTSGVLLLPDVASSMIAGKLMKAEAESENGKAYIEISLTISAQYNKDSATSYVFICDFHNGDSTAHKKLLDMIPKKLQLKK